MIVDDWEVYRRNPVGFVHKFWPAQKLTDYQADILASVADNPETFVYSGHKLGKTFCAAMAAAWFFLTRKARVYLIARTETNLETALWPALLRLLDTVNPDGRLVLARFPLSRTHLAVKVVDTDGGTDKNCFIRGFLQNEQEAIAGQHLPRLPDGSPSVLVVVDEASNQEAWLYDTVSAYAHRLLMIGNPIHAIGTFYDKCKAGDAWHHDEDRPDAPPMLYRKVFHVSAEDSPNVRLGRARAGQGLPPCDDVPGILTYADYRQFSKIWPAHKRRWGLDGLFPDEAVDRLFPADWLELAHTLYDRLRQYEAELQAGGEKKGTGSFCRNGPQGFWTLHNTFPSPFSGGMFDWGPPFALGIDCGRSVRGDLTTFTVVGRYGWVYSESHQIADTAVTYHKTIELARRFKIKATSIAFDAAIGGPIADQLRDRKGWNVAAVNFGSTEHIDRDKYHNQRAAMYGEVAAAMDLRYRIAADGSKHLRGRLAKMLETPVSEWRKHWTCVAIPREESELRQELAVLPRHHSQRSGALLLPPKDPRPGRVMRPGEFCLRELLGRSPDRGDSFALAFYALGRGIEIRELSRCDGPLFWW